MVQKDRDEHFPLLTRYNNAAGCFNEAVKQSAIISMFLYYYDCSIRLTKDGRSKSMLLFSKWKGIRQNIVKDRQIITFL